MTLPSSIVPTFRAHWEDRFIDAAAITRETAQGVLNTTTGQISAGTFSTIWDGTGGCLIRPTSRTETDFGQKQTDVELYSVFLPHDVTGVLPGDRLTVSACTYDADLVGAVLVVREVVSDSYKTKTSLVCERIKA